MYILFWFYNLIFKRQNFKQAYNNIPFEIEAYRNDQHLDYVPQRKYWSWRDYICSKCVQRMPEQD